MKIGITCYPTYGGSGAVATELGIALAERGHDVHFISYEQPFRLPQYLPNVSFHEVSIGNYPLFEYPPYDLALAVRMHDVVRTQGLDLLHVHYAIPHATSAWRSALRGIAAPPSRMPSTRPISSPSAKPSVNFVSSGISMGPSSSAWIRMRCRNLLLRQPLPS